MNPKFPTTGSFDTASRLNEFRVAQNPFGPQFSPTNPSDAPSAEDFVPKDTIDPFNRTLGVPFQGPGPVRLPTHPVMQQPGIPQPGMQQPQIQSVPSQRINSSPTPTEGQVQPQPESQPTAAPQPDAAPVSGEPAAAEAKPEWTESAGSFRTTYIGIKNDKGVLTGQVEVQFNPNTKTYTAYGLSGPPVVLPENFTRESIANGSLTGGLSLIPFKGPGSDQGASHVKAFEQIVQDTKAGTLDAEASKRAAAYLEATYKDLVKVLEMEKNDPSVKTGYSDESIDGIIKYRGQYEMLTKPPSTEAKPEQPATSDSKSEPDVPDQPNSPNPPTELENQDDVPEFIPDVQIRKNQIA